MAHTMRAWVLHGARDLRLDRVPVPAPRDGEVLVRPRAAGICGSDLHYHAHGRIGRFVPTAPFILGHEFAGEVAALGPGVTGLSVGDRVAVDPSRACRRCALCRQGRYNLCPNMVYYGTASVSPPADGCFAEFVTAPATNCFRLPDGFEAAWGALLEPLSVALHATLRTTVAGRSVLVTGGGTIGQLVAAAARVFGGSPVVVSDPRPFARGFALRQGADAALDPAEPGAGAMPENGFEVVFEASGAAPALEFGIRAAARGATVVQVGTLDDGIPVPVNTILTRELTYTGSWRFANVFERGLSLLATGRIDPRPFITHTLPFEDLDRALDVARSGDGVVKVQVRWTD